MGIITKAPTNWIEIFVAQEVYETLYFDLKHLRSIRYILSISVKDKYPKRVYKTKTTDTIISVERLK